MHTRADPRGHAGEGSALVERIDHLSGMARLAPEWERLSATQKPWLPYLGPVWNRLWWRHFAERSPLVTDRLYVRAVRSAGGELLAVAPLMLTERPATGPLRARMLQFFGADPWMTEARGVACRPGAERAAYGALFAHLRDEFGEWDFMRWNGVPASAAPIFAHGGDNLNVLQGASSFVLELPRSWPELKAGLSRNIKESLRKCYNSLRRDGFSPEFRAISERDRFDALDTFYKLHGERARRADTIDHNDVFAGARSRAFLRDYFTESAPETAWVFQLLLRGRVVATRLGFRSGSELYLYYSGYDPDWARYSVMTTLVAETLKWAIDSGITTVNLSFGRDVSKTRWRPREVPFSEARWHSPSVRGRLLQHAFTRIENLRHTNRLGAVTRTVMTRLATRGTGVRL